MSYNIPISDPPQFTSVEGKPPAFQDWSFDPDSILEVVSFLGTGNPSNITVDTVIKDYRADLQLPSDTQVFVQIELDHPVLNGIETPWLTVSGVIASAGGDGYELLRGNRDVDTILAINVASIPRGTSTTRIIFKIFTKPDGGQLTFLDEKNYYVKLIRLNTGDITITPSAVIEFHHEIGESLPAGQNRTVNTGDSFTLEVDDHISVTSDGDLNLDFEEEGVKTYSGSNTQELTFTLESSIEDETDTDPYYYAEAVFQTQNGAIDVQGIKTYVHSNDEDINIQPLSMEFFAIKGVQQAGAQKIFIRGLGAWSIAFPNWMKIVGSSTGNDDADRNILPLFYQNLTPGTYTGNIVVTMGGDDYVIPVKHTLVDQFDINMEENGLHFTKDRETISYFYGENRSKINLETNTSLKAYSTLNPFNKTNQFVRGVYNKKTHFWLGDVLHKVMPSLENVDKISLPGLPSKFNFLRYYNPSSTDLTVNTSTLVVTNSDSRTFYNLRFIKGRKPSRFSAMRGIVDFYESAIRVTLKSRLYLNLYSNRTATVIRMYKNGEQIERKTIANNEFQLFGLGITFGNYSPGDVIEARYYVTKADYYSQKYIVFPEGKHSYHIGWEDEHGLLQLLEFTGDYSIESEREGITIDTFNEYLERTEKAETIKQAQLTANTGWLLKENQERIGSLLDAKKAWAFTPSGKTINLIPKSGNLSNEDSERANWAHVLKFKINPEHANQDYTF